MGLATQQIRLICVGLEEATQPLRTKSILPHSELTGFLAGLKEAVNFGISRIPIQTDTVLVKAVVEGDEYCLSEMGGVITEIKHLMHVFRFFFPCIISVCSRVYNKVVYAIASIGLYKS